jgi:enolase
MKLFSTAVTTAKLGATALLAASLSACVVAPIGYRHHGYGYAGQVAVEVAPVVVAPPPPVVVVPAPYYGYPRYYRR